MSSRKSSPGTRNPILHSAAWGISLWATLAFAIGTLLVFAMLHRFFANDIQRRTDTWLAGEVEVLADVADRTPRDRLYTRVVSEVAELATREVPNHFRSDTSDPDLVFFLQADAKSPAPLLWVGSGNGLADLAAIRAVPASGQAPSQSLFDLRLPRTEVPFRVARFAMRDGTALYLGVSERDQMRVLRRLRFQFILLWLVIVLLGFLTVFYSTWRMLAHVRSITEAASRIDQSDLSSRVPGSSANDEVSHLARTLNHMLDRIEKAMHQLHTITDSLAHDLRSPLTAIRGKLEVALSSGFEPERGDTTVSGLVSAIDELDRLSQFLNNSLDLAEARADALRLTRVPVDLDRLLRDMTDLYEPGMSEKGLSIELRSVGPITVFADAALLHRVIANLLDNELKHLPPTCTIRMTLAADTVATLTVEDNGPGFDLPLGGNALEHPAFAQRVRGQRSQGHGLGLAFVAAVVRVHGGELSARNLPTGGAHLTLTLPLAVEPSTQTPERVLAAIA
jgi:signal transduction histidine kinase